MAKGREGRLASYRERLVGEGVGGRRDSPSSNFPPLLGKLRDAGWGEEGWEGRSRAGKSDINEA